MPSAHAVSEPPRRPLGFELALVVIVALAVLVPGIQGYSLVDPWETHYGEVGRTMLHDHDYVQTKWNGTSTGDPAEIEGFRSKPALAMWMLAAGMASVGIERDDAYAPGYSGEMVESARTMVGVRLPFVCAGVAGLALLWWMLARLVSRRLAWLSLLIIGSCPFYCLITRQAIPDMPLAACTMGAVSLFILAVEDGARPVTVFAPRGLLRRRGVALDARHVMLAITGGVVVIQAIYYAGFFAVSPPLAIRVLGPSPAIWLPGLMLLLLAALHRYGWWVIRLPLVLIGGIIAAITNAPVPPRGARQSRAAHVFGDVLAVWERYALDRLIVRELVTAALWPVRSALGRTPTGWRGARQAAAEVTDRVFAMSPITTMRQVYLLGCYSLLGISVLAKGPPGLAVVGAVGVFHVLLLGRWRDLYDGAFEIKRGIILMIATFLPWHIAMFLREGPRFVGEYLYLHILNRATVGVDNSPGTFQYYTSQLGLGMWPWVALLPAAFCAAVLRSRLTDRAARVRFTIALWAIGSVAFFCLVQTKFHHYILLAVPPLGVLVAAFLDDVLARRERLHPLFALAGIAIALLLCRDLMHEPERWIEMFVFRYDRPWPAGEPWGVDPSDGFLGLGLAAAIGIALIAVWRRLGVAVLGATGLAICVFALQVYMPIAGTHWGMRDAVRSYYRERTIYGAKLVYFGAGRLHDDWAERGDRWTFESFIPDDLQVGQPMTLTIQVNSADDERVTEKQLALLATATAIGDHTIELTLAPGERAKLAPLVQGGARGKRGRPTLCIVDADRLLAWQLYWRGEQFWSGGEIWGPLPELKTSFPATDNARFTKYLNDRTRAPIGRRYFVIGESGRLPGARSLVPTQRGRDSFSVIDTTSNKFALAAFVL